MITYKVTVDKDGTTRWYNENGEFHRVDGPAVEYADGKSWFLNGDRHRVDGPAIERADGYKEWFLNGKLHREGGPAIEYEGGKSWYLNGERHREDGPAIEWADGAKFWWVNGKQHREDGPACTSIDGATRWYWEGIEYLEYEYWQIARPSVTLCLGDIVQIHGKHYTLKEVES